MLRVLLVPLVALAIAISALALSILLATASGLAGVLAIAATFVTATAWGGLAAWAGRRKLPTNTYAIATTAVGTFLASIAVSIVLAATSAEWRLSASQLPHMERAFLSFTVYGVVFLAMGLPRLRQRMREGRLDIRSEGSGPAKIHPGKRAPRGIYRTD